MKQLIDNLMEIGFNSYEAKVYLALLKKYPVTGYEVSKLADIPQSRAYDTLKALENSQIVMSSKTKPVTYTPINPKELTKRYKRKVSSTLDFLDKKLPSVKEDYTEPIHTVSGTNSIREKLIEIIKNAKKEIYLEIWSQDFKYIENNLLDAYNRGLEIKIVGYDDFDCMFGTFFQHISLREIENTIGGRTVYITVDEEEGLFGRIDSKRKDNITSLWTKNRDIALLIKEFIIHDMYLIDIEANFPEQLRYFYGKNWKKLKDKVLNGSSMYNIGL